MNKKSMVIIRILICIIVLMLIIFFVVKNMLSNDTEPSNVVDNSNQLEKKEEFEDFEIDVPDGYEIIGGDKIITSDLMYTKAVAYKYDEQDSRTYLNVYLQNRGKYSFYKDAICVISFYDENYNFLLRTSGIIEEDFNIPVGSTTVVKTEFYDSPGNVARVEINFENVETPYEEIQIESDILPIE